MGWNFKPKYPEVPIGTLPTVFTPLSEFNKVPWRTDLLNLFRVLAVLAGALAFAGMITWNMRAYLDQALHPRGLIIGAFIFMPFLVGFLSWRGLRQVYLHLIESSDRKALNPGIQEALYLGVAFCEGVWLNMSCQSWDRGYLHFDRDGLVFNARVGDFALPFHLIRGAQIKKACTVLPSANPRLFIEWVSPTGQANTLSFEDMGSSSDPAVLESIMDRVLRKLPGAKSPEIESFKLPLESASISFPNTPANFQSFQAERAPFLLLLFLLIPGLVKAEFVLDRFFEKHVISMIFSMGSPFIPLLLANRATFWYSQLRRARLRTSDSGQFRSRIP